MNCGFIGTGWAEFGYLGVIIYGLIAGGMAQFIQNFVMIRSVHGKKLHLVWFQAIQIPLWTIVLASAGITQFFAGQGLLVAFVLVWWLGNRLYDVDEHVVTEPFSTNPAALGDAQEPSLLAVAQRPRTPW